jgi:hypothetical protein
VEHVIPESLGNSEYTLPSGVVCDNCNNYFAREIEKPFLDAPSIVHVRHRQEIGNKRNFIPPVVAIHLESATAVNMTQSEIYPVKENEADKFIRSIFEREKGTLVIPINPEIPTPYVTSRFICKIALEALAYRFISISASVDEIVSKTELDPIRNYVRNGDLQKRVWEYNERQLYDEDMIFSEGNSNYQVLHEFTFLQTELQETIFVLALFGVEYVISLDRPLVAGYHDWLTNHEGKSPLYPLG